MRARRRALLPASTPLPVGRKSGRGRLSLRGWLLAALGGRALLLFHGLARLFGALGAEFGALLALFVHHLLAAENFDERLGAAVSLAEAGQNDAGIAAIAVAKARADRVEQLVDRLWRHQERRGQTAVWNPAFFAERNHLLDVGLHELGLGDGGLDALFHDQRGDEIPQQSAPVGGVPAQFPTCYTMTHDSILRYRRSRSLSG